MGNTENVILTPDIQSSLGISYNVPVIALVIKKPTG